jgi:hypothetical protein
MYNNGHCSTCDVEKQCAYEYKPCDCCGYRKFKAKEEPKPVVLKLVVNKE